MGKRFGIDDNSIEAKTVNPKDRLAAKQRRARYEADRRALEKWARDGFTNPGTQKGEDYE